MAKREAEDVKIFLVGDAAACAKKGQQLPQGYYNVEIMLKSAARRNVAIGVCGACMDARGIAETELAEGCKRSSLEELTDWTQWADKVITF